MPPDRVLGEMQALGLSATELGPPDYLPAPPGALRALLDGHGLRLAAGFLAVVLHETGVSRRSLLSIRRQAERLAAAGGEVLVLAAALQGDGYDARFPLTPKQWAVLFRTLSAATELAADCGIGLALHPHFGTALETQDDVARLLDATTVPLCLDTGHLYLGGMNPAAFAEAAAGRVTHVHLKDVDAGLAARVRQREVPYTAAVRMGLYRPLGKGNLDFASICRPLEKKGYMGWYVLEQDVALQGEPESDGGPAWNVRLSLEHLRSLLSTADR